MTEPRSVAQRTRPAGRGILHWSLSDDRIGTRSEAYALRTPGGVVLVDPLPLRDAALEALGQISAICLTIQSHQRSAWRLRRRFGARVYAPARAVGREERADVRYREGDELPGGLVAIHAPGPAHAGFVLLLERPRGVGALFLGDLLMREAGGGFAFVPDEFMDAPARARESVRKILALPFDAAYPGHGAPMTRGAKPAIRRALDHDEQRRAAA